MLNEVWVKEIIALSKKEDLSELRNLINKDINSINLEDQKGEWKKILEIFKKTKNEEEINKFFSIIFDKFYFFNFEIKFGKKIFKKKIKFENFIIKLDEIIKFSLLPFIYFVTEVYLKKNQQIINL